MPVVRVERGGGDPLNPAGDLLLRPALEAALARAREGEDEKPPVPAPASLRPFLRFAKLPPRALAATRRALDTDGDFRARVTETLDEADVGRAGWLFLSRPPGWEDELASLVSGAEEEAEQAADQRAEHDARRRLAGAEEASRRAEQAAAAARSEAAQAVATLAEERRVRQLASDEAAAAARRAESLAAERDRARGAAAAAAAEVEALRRRLRQLEVQVDDLRSSAEAAVAAAAPGPAVPAAPAAPAAPALRAPAVEARSFAGSADVGRALRDAARAASRLAEALAAAADPLAEEPEVPVAGPGPQAPVPAPPARRSRRGERSGAPERQPLPLPPAIYDDSTEAAEHLLRVRGVTLVVDGYNVTLSGWPEVPLPDQRQRLVDALTELAARTGADVTVVFDGAEQVMPGVVPKTARAVRMRFSPPGVEADDEVLALVNDLPPHRPVVVATSDRRVQQAAARAGANVISSRQLLAVLRR